MSLMMSLREEQKEYAHLHDLWLLLEIRMKMSIALRQTQMLVSGTK